jgi:hypothetical protein
MKAVTLDDGIYVNSEDVLKYKDTVIQEVQKALKPKQTTPSGYEIIERDGLKGIMVNGEFFVYGAMNNLNKKFNGTIAVKHENNSNSMRSIVNLKSNKAVSIDFSDVNKVVEFSYIDYEIIKGLLD